MQTSRTTHRRFSGPDEAFAENVRNEFDALPEKVTPASADVMIVEDSASGHTKKRVQVGNLPGGGGGGDVTAAANLTDNRIVRGDGGAKGIKTGDLILDADVDAAAGIAATKIADGSVTNTEFQHIGTLTEDVQAHMDEVTDPHGSIMAVTNSVNTPKIEIVGDITISAFSSQTTQINLTNNGADVADVVLDGKIKPTTDVDLTAEFDSASERGFVIDNIGAGGSKLTVDKIAVTDNTVVTNLNADLLDGVHAAALARLDGSLAYTGTGDGFSDDDTLGSESAVSTVSERAIKNFVENVVGISVDYFFGNTASDIGGIYYDMTDNSLGGGESTLSTAGLGAGDDQPLVNFATLVGVPGIETLRTGIWDVHIHAERTAGTRTVNLYAKIYKRTTGGAETLLLTTHLSDEITSEVEVTLHVVLVADTDIGATDRLIVKFFANVGSSGSAVTIALRQEGSTAAHLTLPTTSDILSSVFIRQDGTKAYTGTGDGFKDEDDMASDSATAVASQQSIKAYVDAAGGGDVTGPGSSTDMAIARFDGTGGKTLQDSGVVITDVNAVSGITQLDVDNLRFDGNTISSTDTNGPISVLPDGTGRVTVGNAGDVVIGDGTLRVTRPHTTRRVDLGSTTKRFNDLFTGGIVNLESLPTSDPGVVGQLWRSGTDLKISI